MKPANELPAKLEIDLQLTDEDRRSPTWAKVCDVLYARICKLRVKNDRPLSAEDTIALRAEIKALKGLLKNDPFKEFSEPRHAVLQHELDAGE